MKILVIRFSSIGDIIYTTPVIRCIKQQLPDVELHYLTKSNFSFIVDNNPYIDKLFLLKSPLDETISDLRKEKYDYIIDLHNTLRSSIVKLKLGVKSSTYKKERLKKWLAIRYKINLVKPVHLVDRYLKTVEFLGVKNDNLPVDYFLQGDFDLQKLLPPGYQQQYIAFIIGATHFTKRMPNEKVIELCRKLNFPVVLLGGKDVAANAEVIAEAVGLKIFNACGTIGFNESVYLVKNAHKVIGFDTGLTHIAEAFNKPIVSIWGSTVPELLGVQPYHVDEVYEAGVALPCRPCSKFGRRKCPLGHFKCMYDIDLNKIADFI
ncbi:heptosyltransferase-2 [Arcticibacter tournemirensis]|uniref:Glycosyltransferase family 9 protein n=1 Tax=Arcticibacter tournemirensis TaxID=699437 RepID=A0A5M9HLP0_9SPHI|nr:glycosyltransferase family 9 protein [Arcticibacter tournemirensis]KAA8486318.1 glycosyltransferase family 9 protein [Arcticibacter tournemirensis]TQM52131.1 heptosyltransferase-2 [Arcticibacter tournemirensis]